MKKLSVPKETFSEALLAAISGIGSQQSQLLYTGAFVGSAAIETGYGDGAQGAMLFSFPRVIGNDDPVVLGTLRKSDLIKLYSQYFVPEGKPAREIYNSIKQIARGKCPLCGGVGHVRTLDHYLPKANFPLYSVLPTNLVPCCRDCNSEKLNAFSTMRGGQTIHPYFDHDHFFTEKWVHARVVPSSPPVLEYFVVAPGNWHPDDRTRAAAHFVEYGLADKFSVEAASDLPETIQTRLTTMANNSPAEFSSYLAEKGATPSTPINNWRRVMFSALAADPWFCSQTAF